MYGSPIDTTLAHFQQAFASRGVETNSALTPFYLQPCWEAVPKHLMLTVERSVSAEKEALVESP
jgi:hypothetical protein